MSDEKKMKELSGYISNVINPYGEGRLSHEEIEEILNLRLDITALCDVGIKNADDYKKKLKQYFKMSKVLYEEYGVEIGGFPLKSPLKLNVNIYRIMDKAGLNKVQVNRLYKEINLKLPKSDVRSSQISFLERLMDNWKEPTIEELMNPIYEQEELDEEDMLLRKQVEEEDREMEVARMKHKKRFKRAFI